MKKSATDSFAYANAMQHRSPVPGGVKRETLRRRYPPCRVNVGGCAPCGRTFLGNGQMDRDRIRLPVVRLASSSQLGTPLLWLWGCISEAVAFFDSDSKSAEGLSRTGGLFSAYRCK